jgi:hypothetical protein
MFNAIPSRHRSSKIRWIEAKCIPIVQTPVFQRAHLFLFVWRFKTLWGHTKLALRCKLKQYTKIWVISATNIQTPANDDKEKAVTLIAATIPLRESLLLRQAKRRSKNEFNESQLLCFALGKSKREDPQLFNDSQLLWFALGISFTPVEGIGEQCTHSTHDLLSLLWFTLGIAAFLWQGRGWRYTEI